MTRADRGKINFLKEPFSVNGFSAQGSLATLLPDPNSRLCWEEGA